MTELTDQEIRNFLVEIIEFGNFPDDSFDVQHLERISGFKKITQNKVQFEIERHPHIFWKPSIGKESSAFVTETYLFELDLNTKKVTILSVETSQPVIDYYHLADEEVTNWFDSVNYERDYPELSKLTTEQQVIDYAKEKVKELEWIDSLGTDEKLPEDFEEKYMQEVEELFAEMMVCNWKS